MRSQVLTTWVVLALGFLSQVNSAIIRARETASPSTDPSEFDPSDPDVVEKLAQASLNNLKEVSETEDGMGYKRGDDGRCTWSNVVIRREWGTLSKQERKAYIDAVLCLQSKPSMSDPAQVPGARTRYDDFVATHINQTLTIHNTANFLSWHRYYLWHYEQALRNECGYKGYQPYWDWAKYAQDPEKSPVFDGSPYSMSGNGVYVPGRNNTLYPPIISVPPGNGGGCLKSGPFKDVVVNLGPVSLFQAIEGVNLNSLPSGLGYNPRCLRRDIGNYISSHWTRAVDIAELILNHTDILSFQNRMQGDFPNGYMGVHAGGHFTCTGDPGGDFYSSPGDPVFFLHHAMIDRVWWIWQNMDPCKRTQTIGGTITFVNVPPSRNGTLDDTIDLGVIAPQEIALKELMSTVEGPFCYIYL